MADPNFFQTLLNGLRGIFSGAPSTAAVLQAITPAQPLPVDVLPENDPAPRLPAHPKVCLVIYDPVVPIQRNRRLSEILGWNDPHALIQEFISDLQIASHGYANYQIAEQFSVDAFPQKEDGFCYTGGEYLRCWRDQAGFHQPDGVDYSRLLADFHLPEKIKSGAIDEVWTVGFPFAGFYESRMAGPGAFWCNSPTFENSAAGRRYVMMAFNFERGVGEMLESYAHRAESILDHAFRPIPEGDPRNLWKRFTRYDQIAPGQAEVGTVHFAPNSTYDYDWGNESPVLSGCRNWQTFPNLSGAPQLVTCAEWGNGDLGEHHRWWLNALPHVPGKTAGIPNNWWEFIVDPNRL